MQRDPIGYAAGMNVYSYVRNRPTYFVDPTGLWGVQFGENGPNIGIGAPTFLFGNGSGAYFLDSLAATADGFIPFSDPFKEEYNLCDKNLEISKGLGAFSRNAFLAAGTLWAAAELGLISKSVPIDKVLPNLSDDFFRVGPKHSAIKSAREVLLRTGEQHKAVQVLRAGGGRYEIIDGHHTWEAVKQVGKKTIEIMIRGNK